MSANHAQQATIHSFELLMDAVGKAIHEVVGDNHGADLLSKLEALTENVIREIEADGFTHPPRLLSNLRQAFQTLRQAPEQLAAQPHPTGHRLLWYLLWCYRDYLTASAGAEEADRRLSELFSSFRRKRGRPTELPLVTVMRARKLWDAGKSYAEVGILLGRNRQQVRSALRHHYPEKKSK